MRGAPPCAFDRILATRLGVGAVKVLGDGETGVLLADVVDSIKPVHVELTELAQILAK
ncbi:MAG: hypothetical protein P4L71_10065 [Acetobacteraceae bacterium]|nr:hypothetical protein [Acetobacteraceae bacterium]